MKQREIKLLFTSVGRRIELMQAFKKAGESAACKLIIYGVDLSLTAPALFFCDVRKQICRINDTNYIPDLIKICEEEQIDLVIPTIDTDLLLLAKNKEKFEKVNTKVLISAEDKIAICRDKRLTADFFANCGLHTPKPVDNVENYHAGFPCFIKPKDGSSSIDAYKVDNQEDLIAFSHKVSDYIIQPFIEGTEYTVDIFCDFNGEPIFIIPRIRMAVRSGEVLQTEIVMDQELIEESKRLIKQFKPCGPITVQLIKQSGTGDNYYIEINPRYGGGAPLTMKAGADSAEAILTLLQNQTVDGTRYPIRNGAIYSRFDQSVCVKEGNERGSLKAIVFDLDDTLYSEKDYIRSGYHKIAEFLQGVNCVEERLWNYFLAGKPAIDELLSDEKIMDTDTKKACLDIYRKQKPQITLYQEAAEFIKELKEKGIKLGIITDGRIEGQRAKIEALGLSEIIDEILITDEIGNPKLFRKPSDIPFRIMQRRLGETFERMAYIGDNMEKDIKTPLSLGMKMLYFKNEDGIYPCSGDDIQADTAHNWKEIKAWIQKRI